MNALDAWGEQLRSWRIPSAILDAAAESPYGFPTEPFLRRATVAMADARSPTTIRALEGIPERGTVVDVGVGAGSTSMPLAGRAALITGVDTSDEMLAAFRTVAAGGNAKVVTVLGPWPDVAPEVDRADVVVCGHVLYNVQDLGPFAEALNDHARSRVVIELTPTHPWSWMNDLWIRFHDLERPAGPTADDAESAIQELGIATRRDHRVVSASARGGAGFERREDAVALVRRRLCLSRDRDEEIADALGDRLGATDGVWSAGPPEQSIATLWWDP